MAIVAIVSVRTYFPPLIIVALLAILFLLTIVAVWPFSVRPIINFCKNLREIRKNNKVAKRFFVEFAESNFKDDFKHFIADSTGKYKPYAFHFVINTLLKMEEFKGKIPEPPINLINLYFNHWNRTFNHSNRTKKDFDLVFWDFENILHEYYSLFIEGPIEAIKEVGSEVPEDIKRGWKKAVDDYNEFAKKWNDFCKRVRRGFGVSEDFLALHGILSAEEL